MYVCMYVFAPPMPVHKKVEQYKVCCSFQSAKATLWMYITMGRTFFGCLCGVIGGSFEYFNIIEYLNE